MRLLLISPILLWPILHHAIRLIAAPLPIYRTWGKIYKHEKHQGTCIKGTVDLPDSSLYYQTRNCIKHLVNPTAPASFLDGSGSPDGSGFVAAPLPSSAGFDAAMVLVLPPSRKPSPLLLSQGQSSWVRRFVLLTPCCSLPSLFRVIIKRLGFSGKVTQW